MEVKNCRRCGKMFNYYGKPICPECEEKEEEEFKLVKEYIYDHPKCSAAEAADATGVAVRTIINFLKDDRLEAVDGLSELLTCEKCGVMIKSGRYCPKCMERMKNLTSKLLNETTANYKNIEESDRFKGKSRIYIRDENDKDKE